MYVARNMEIGVLTSLFDLILPLLTLSNTFLFFPLSRYQLVCPDLLKRFILFLPSRRRNAKSWRRPRSLRPQKTCELLLFSGLSHSHSFRTHPQCSILSTSYESRKDSPIKSSASDALLFISYFACAIYRWANGDKSIFGSFASDLTRIIPSGTSKASLQKV